MDGKTMAKFPFICQDGNTQLCVVENTGGTGNLDDDPKPWNNSGTDAGHVLDQKRFFPQAIEEGAQATTLNTGQILSPYMTKHKIFRWRMHQSCYAKI